MLFLAPCKELTTSRRHQLCPESPSGRQLLVSLVVVLCGARRPFYTTFGIFKNFIEEIVGKNEDIVQEFNIKVVRKSRNDQFVASLIPLMDSNYKELILNFF